MPKVILDAGHGGSDVGEYYESRSEKNDNLLLAFRIGQFLGERGIEVEYTRSVDVYLPMSNRVAIANRMGGDLLVSLHRLSVNYVNSAPDLDFYIGDNNTYGEKAANNIGQKLHCCGYECYGIVVRTDIPLINDTDMTAIMIRLGYMRSEKDSNFVKLAENIAEGIYRTLFESEENVREWDNYKSVYHYRVGIGPYSNYDRAVEKQLTLCMLGYVTEIMKIYDRYYVYTQGFEDLDLAGAIELQLRRYGCNTYLIKE